MLLQDHGEIWEPPTELTLPLGNIQRARAVSVPDETGLVFPKVFVRMEGKRLVGV